MYEEFLGHFGFVRNPFQGSPDPAHYYSTAAHDEALLQLVSRIEARQGFLVLTGDAGTGKTMVLRYLLDWLRKYSYSTAYVFYPLFRSTDLLELILGDFGIPCHSHSKKELMLTLKNWLIDRRKMGDCPVIIIDEAQALKSRALRKLGALLKMEVRGARLLQLVLAGQPRLEKKLNRPKLAWLQSRMMCHCKLPALTTAETGGYIGSRLAGAGAADKAAFAPECVLEIFQHSRGIPRVINLLCEHALLAAYGDRRKTVIPSDVLRAAQYFDLCDEAEESKEESPSGAFRSLIPFPDPEGAAEPEPGVSKDEPVSAVELDPAIAGREAEPSLAAPMAPVAVRERTPLAIDSAATPILTALEPMPVTVSVHVLIPEYAVSRNDAVPARRFGAMEDETVLALEPRLRAPEAGARESPAALAAPAAEADTEGEPEPIVAVTALEAVLEVPAPATKKLASVSATPIVVPTPVAAAASVHRPRTPAKNGPAREEVLAVPRPARGDSTRTCNSQPKPVHSRNREALVRLVRAKTRFVQYWRAVVWSLIRDGREFGRQCSVWLQKPADTAWTSAVKQRTFLAVCARLRQPLHSGQAAREHPQASSASHKHF
jgi:general secretion pathway protein A